MSATLHARLHAGTQCVQKAAGGGIHSAKSSSSTRSSGACACWRRSGRVACRHEACPRAWSRGGHPPTRPAGPKSRSVSASVIASKIAYRHRTHAQPTLSDRAPCDARCDQVAVGSNLGSAQWPQQLKRRQVGPQHCDKHLAVGHSPVAEALDDIRHADRAVEVEEHRRQPRASRHRHWGSGCRARPPPSGPRPPPARCTLFCRSDLLAVAPRTLAGCWHPNALASPGQGGRCRSTATACHRLAAPPEPTRVCCAAGACVVGPTTGYSPWSNQPRSEPGPPAPSSPAARRRRRAPRRCSIRGRRPLILITP